MRFFLPLIIGCLISGAHAAAPGEEGAELARSMGIAIPAPAPDRRDGEGSGPHTRLVIDQVMLVEGNPVANFKRLYGTGHYQLNRETDELERAGGVRYTIKSGVVYDAKTLLADVRELVANAREAIGPDAAHEEH